MRRRFYAPPQAFSSDGSSVTLSPDEAQHLRNVLRLKTGDEAYIFDGLGHEYRGQIETTARDQAVIQIIEPVTSAAESALNLTIAVALLKGEKFDLVVQKLTELGVVAVVPLTTTHADVRLRNDDDAERKLIRWRRIVVEATKQCGRARLMTIEPLASFTELTQRSKPANELRLMFSERAGAQLSDAVATESNPETVTALIGSEGGWADDEINQARGAGWQIVTLRSRIMRAETAAIACAALLQHRFGDLI